MKKDRKLAMRMISNLDIRAFRRRLRYLALRARSAFPSKTPTAERPACNICGFRLLAAGQVCSERETRSCAVCGSTLRFRAITAALQSELDGDHQIRVLERMPKRKHLKGLGMSDAHVYALALEDKFDYINTYYHTEPLLDLRSPAQHYLGRFDFIVSSDVL